MERACDRDSFCSVLNHSSSPSVFIYEQPLIHLRPFLLMMNFSFTLDIHGLLCEFATR